MEDKIQLPINVNHNQIPEKEASIYVIPEIILGVKYALFQYWDTEKKKLIRYVLFSQVYNLRKRLLKANIFAGVTCPQICTASTRESMEMQNVVDLIPNPKASLH